MFSARQLFIAIFFFASLAAKLCDAHSWVACSDYRGDLNFFEQSQCFGWPRSYRPSAAGNQRGYQIAYPDSQAYSGGQNRACNSGLAYPWESAYDNDAYPSAVYEQGRVYCLAWPMKNHGILPTSCDNPISKSDAGTQDTLHLYVSEVNPTRDPTQSEFNTRNINELASLATRCNPDLQPAGSSRQFEDECQLGLEKHRDNQRDCKGFLRSPKLCDSSGEAMGTGCFKIPADMTPGHYIAQWYWETTFDRDPDQRLAYQSCFDFEVVEPGSSKATLGRTGTSGSPASDLPCTNNVDKFLNAAVEGGGGGDPPPPTSDDAAEVFLACAKEGEECSDPSWAVQKCCETGTRCDLWQNTQYGRCSRQSKLEEEEEEGNPPPPLPISQCQGEVVVNEGEECDDPEWSNPKCCSQDLTCEYWEDTQYARCRSSTTTTTDDFSSPSFSFSCQGESAHEGEECDHPDWSNPKCCSQDLTCEYWEDTQYARCQQEQR
jgi:hypothetical protein